MIEEQESDGRATQTMGGAAKMQPWCLSALVPWCRGASGWSDVFSATHHNLITTTTTTTTTTMAKQSVRLLPIFENNMADKT